MTALKSLTFTTIPTPGGIQPGSPIQGHCASRRAKAYSERPELHPNREDWVKKDGVRTIVEMQQRVPLWWRQHPNGFYAVFVRSGLKPIEFEKGKTAIAVSSLDKLPSVIDTLIAAIRAGELDAQLAHTSKQGAPKKTAA